MPKMKYILLPLFVFYLVNCTKIDSEYLKCLVCEKSLEELNNAVKKLDPAKRVDVGGYRLDADGNYNHKSVSQTKSELQLSELIENVCNKMDDYVRATFKSNGTLTLIRLVTEGGLSPLMSEVDLIQDEDLNKSLKYNCESIMEEHEEEIIKLYQSGENDIVNEFCIKESNLCKKFKSKKQEL